MADENGILSRVRGLLAKAESTEFEAERDALNAKAAELLAKYGLEEALKAHREPELAKVERRTIYCEAPYAVAKVRLYNAVAKPFRCRPIRIPGTGTITLDVFGYAADLDRTELLYTSLLVQMSVGATKLYRKDGIKSFRIAWMAGFASVIRTRLEAAENKETSSAGTSTALVLVDRSKQVNAAFEVAHPNVVNRKSYVRADAFNDGKEAGRRAHLGDGASVQQNSRRQLT